MDVSCEDLIDDMMKEQAMVLILVVMDVSCEAYGIKVDKDAKR